MKQQAKGSAEEVYNYNYTLQNAYKRLTEAAISEQDRETVRNYISHLACMGVSKGRLAKILFHLKVFSEHLGCKIIDAKRQDMERFVIWLKGAGYAPNTESDYVIAVKRFYKFVRYGNVDLETPWPEEVRWMRKAIKPNQTRQPELLTSGEVEAMIKVAPTQRDKAMLAVGFEAGLRATELLTLDVQDVSFDESGSRIKVRGKTGERMVRLISSAPILARYLESHPLKAEPQSPLWITYSTNYWHKRVSWRLWSGTIKDIAKKCGISRRVHNHMLRHGSATRNAKFLTDSELKIMYGWSMTSKMPAVYVHLSGKDLDGKLASMYSGKPYEPPKPGFVPAVCPRCSERSSPGMHYCPRCSSPLDPAEQGRKNLEDQAIRDEIRRLREIVDRCLGGAGDCR